MPLVVSGGGDCPSYQGWCVMQWTGNVFEPVQAYCGSGYACPPGSYGPDEKDYEALYVGFRVVVCCESGS